MARRITNCHIHTFTEAHVPKVYPHPAIAWIRAVPWLPGVIAKALGIAGQEKLSEKVGRLAEFQKTGRLGSQAAVFRSILPFYPGSARFVVLPMDMAGIGFGPVAEDLRSQHDALARLAREEKPGRVLPFATCDPRREESVAEAERAIGELGFRGLKIYPRLGFPPDHPALMQRLYPMLAERGLPVMSHCSRGGVRGRDVSSEAADAFTDPRAVLPALDAHEGLRICLAHFGGSADWRAYVDEGIDPDDPGARARNWVASLVDLLGSGDHPGLWTDISYTLFRVADYVPFLKVFLKDERVLSRTLFGSDYYMTRQEELSERAVCFRLREALGERLFWRIADQNPGIWLGEEGGTEPPPLDPAPATG
ncbi:amidohydrolase family protein [Roseicyclus sp. F158]|uniref:Amidohydrolase family protein n=1 Tax=Tropicimonas omnivorans TaxID=3075590 RepID=A0ABU3DGC7_9RHOB|nr:amidohydrolase family protein [Roseicyclus sp. F158]MDT0682775.1 amidohydrolase family protein [Roseicyclus sp. F158]